MTSSELKRAKALRGLGGEYNDISNVVEYLRKHENKEVDFLSIAVLVCDVKKESRLPDIMIKDGHLGLPDKEFIKKRAPLTPELLASVELGGGGNVTLPAAALDINTGVMGYIGNDIEGGYFLCGMVQNHINTFGVIVKQKYRTDVALNALLKSGERAPIPFCEDAGKYFDLNNKIVKEKLVILNPKIVQISYSGLFEKGADLDGGKRLADGIRWIKENLESLVMVDTHTYGAEPRRYDSLKPSLEVADMFVCSNDEVKLMIPQYRIKSGPSEEEQKQAFLAHLKENYCKGHEARLYAVTSPEKTSVLYYKPNGKTEEIEVENWFFTTKEKGSIHDATGAGDSWRAGLNAYILNHQCEFKSGKIGIKEAVQFANLTARLYISGKGIEAFKHCDGTYDKLLRVVSGDKPKEDLRDLREVYGVILNARMDCK